MDFLTKVGSLDEFFSGVVMPLSLYGFGSVKDILEMKMWQIQECSLCFKNEDLQNIFKFTRGLDSSK